MWSNLLGFTILSWENTLRDVEGIDITCPQWKKNVQQSVAVVCHAAWEIREEKKNSSPVLFTAQRKLFHPDSVDFLQICNALGIYVELWSSFDSLRFRRSRLPLNPIWELVKWTFDTPAKEISNWRIGIYFSINICRFLHRNALVLRDFVLFILWHFQSHIRLTCITETIPRWRL